MIYVTAKPSAQDLLPEENKMKTTQEILKTAKEASKKISLLTTQMKNDALTAMADEIEAETNLIMEANNADVEDAREKLNSVMIDRLSLSPERIKGMADGIRDVVKLPDPTGKILKTVIRPNGLVIKKVSVAMGVVAMIYESRPNVTSDAAALSLKSGNVCVLRSGKEAIRSSTAIVKAMKNGLKKAGLSEDLINLIEDTSRNSANELMTAVGYVDLLIPRGGAGLIASCVANAKIPCIQTGTGICHVFVDESADFDMALNIIENAKTSRPSVCNAEEVLLVHKSIAEKFLPALKKRLVFDRERDGKVPVELRLCERAAKIIDGTPAGEKDFDTEFLNYILAVKIVDNVHAAIEHIGLHSTHHSDAIITENKENAELFTAITDSAAVYVNASTRFTDGGEFGFGAEMGISTQKMHARGPMGLKEITTTKYIIYGSGQIR